MNLQNLLNEETAIPEHLQKSFNNFFVQLQDRIKNETGIDISEKWVAGLLNQFHNFKYLDKILQSHEDNGNDQSAKDTQARIIARNALARVGVLDKANGYLPKNRGLLSAMRQYYSDPVHTQRLAQDAAKSTRIASAQEFEEWYNRLSSENKKFVDNLQELNPEEVATFKNVLNAKESKREFAFKMHEWVNKNDVAFQLFKNMEFITPQGKLSLANIEKFRKFLNSLTPARIKDVISKASVYAGKKITHDTHRAKNYMLKNIEKDPDGFYSKAINLYHFVSSKIADVKDKDRAFRRLLNKVPAAWDEDGNLTLAGQGAYKLFKTFGGQQIDPSRAIIELNKAYRYPASSERRAAKAATRGDNISKVSEI